MNFDCFIVAFMPFAEINALFLSELYTFALK
jgi:hypothetical protein